MEKTDLFCLVFLVAMEELCQNLLIAGPDLALRKLAVKRIEEEISSGNLNYDVSLI